MAGTWLTGDEQRTWRAYLHLQGELNARLNRQLQTDSGLSLADYGVLANLSEAPAGRTRPFELAAVLHWEQSRLSHHLRRMERRGLVRREACDTDARGSLVAITDDGQRAIEKAAPAHVAAVRSLLFDHLTKAQVGALERVCRSVIDGLGSSGDPPR